MLWLILLIISLVLFVLVVAFLLPNALLKNSYSISANNVRGIKKHQINDKNIVVYEPCDDIKKYIKQFVLGKKPSGKFLVGKINENISYIDFDVVIYGVKSQILTVMNVKEKITKKGYFEEVLLPEETAYVSIVLNEVDDKKFDFSIYSKITAVSTCMYILFCAVAIFIQAFCTKICLSFFIGGIYRESFLINTSSNLITVIIASILSIMSAIFVLISVKLKNKKKWR